MNGGPPEPPSLRDVIAAAIWRRVTGGVDDRWEDLWLVDREEFLEDADAVLAALVDARYSLPEPLQLHAVRVRAAHRDQLV